MGSYSRAGYMALILEVAENTALTPTFFIPFLSEDIVTEWGSVPVTPVAGNRTLNIRSVKTAIPAPTGTINILVEPTTIGWFLKGVFGTLNSGQLMKVTELAGDWAAADTVTGAGATTATLDFLSSENDYFLVSSPSSTFTDGEAISNGSTGTGFLVQHDATVYGHEVSAPQSSLPTFTVEFGYDNEAVRYTGVRFTALNSITQDDNVIVAGITMVARNEFKHAKVTAITTAAAGSQTITVDQTTGLVAGDSVKVFRPSVNEFVDLPSSAVKIHTIDSITNEKALVVSVLHADIAIGDLLMLGPLTPSYTTLDPEFSFIGGSVIRTNDSITESLEDYAAESLDEIDFATHVNWDDAGDMDSENGNAAYTHSGGTGTLTQVAADQNTAAVGNVWYEFTYTASGYSGDVAATITTAYALTAETVSLVAGTHTITFKSAAAPTDFVLSYTSGSGGSTIDNVSLKQKTPADSIENFELVLTNDIEMRHAAVGTDVHDRFPAKAFLKGLTGTIRLDRTYDDMTYLGLLRQNTSQGVYVEHTGGQIGSTGQYFGLDWRVADGVLKAFNPSISEDDLLNQEMLFDMYDSSGDGFTAKALLTNDISAYT